MKIATHEVNGIRIAEVISDECIINTVDEALQLLVDLYYQEFDKVIAFKSDYFIIDFFINDNFMGLFAAIL